MITFCKGGTEQTSHLIVIQPLLSFDNHLSRVKPLDSERRWSGSNVATHFVRCHCAKVGCDQLA